MSQVRFDQQTPKIRASPSPGRSRQRPKPILKSLPPPEPSPLPFSTYPLHSPHVHFPPTPTLTSTSFTHSAIVYDRAPIDVTENVCALPERGGRCYTLQPRNKHSSRRASGRCHSGVDGVGVGVGVGVGGVSAGSEGSCALNSPEPKGSYFHPRAFEACEPERCAAVERYDSYFFPDSLSSSSSESESSVLSSSSESDSDSDSSYASFSPTSSSSIPRAVVDSLALGHPSFSAYPSDSSQNGPQQQQSRQQLSPSLILRQSHQHSQQSSHIVHYYPCSPSPGLVEGKPKKSATSSGSGNGQKVKNAARLAKFGGGFSDQSMVLEGCLGGF
ncbi:hypothetical protein AN958_09804 [Leucoagaricus sp. SymC.cos]|nr:hypothetical protein AN958_09804 [Leucoagaricus sp. SymC.cos]